jgi:hypothetical protein
VEGLIYERVGLSRKIPASVDTAREDFMDAWWPEAIKLQFAYQNGGTFSGGPFRGVIHTTEFKTYTPSTTDYYGKYDPPHFTMVMSASDLVKVYQHFPITVAARALQHHPKGVETNRRSAIQIEIAWVAAEIDKLPFPIVQKLWDWMRWVEDQTDVKQWISRDFLGLEARGYNSPSRMTDQEWNDFNGWCGHQHVPGNFHWDPGKLDIDALTRITRPGTPRCETANW